MPESDSLSHRIRKALRIDRALRLVWGCAHRLTLATYLLQILQGTLPLLALYLMKLVVDAVTQGWTEPDHGAVLHRVTILIVLAGLVALVGIVLRNLSNLVDETLSQVVTDHVSDVLHAKSVEVDLQYYENPKYYDSLHRAQREAPYRPARIVKGLAQVGQSGVSLVAMAGLLFAFHWFLAAILFAASLPGILVRLRYSGKMFTWQRGATQRERRAWYYHWMMTDGGHAKEIRLFDLGGLFRHRFRDLREGLRGERIGLLTRRSAADFAAQAGATAVVFGTYGYIAFEAVKGTITIGDLVMYFGAFQRGLSALQELLGGLAGLYEDNLFLTNFTEFMDIEPRVTTPDRPKPVPDTLKSGIAFEDVTFSYRTGDRPALDRVSIHIPPGEVLALVGENGSGKTTLAKLLCRLYDPASGAVTLDGTDVRDFDLLELRKRVSVVMQDYVRYSLTARENIRAGDITRTGGDDAVAQAAEASGSARLIEGLPRGYDSVLGCRFEEGQELSVGEWQKIALARSFFRETPIVVLDEPTSALDAVAEAEVLKAFREKIEGKTAILISHRLSTARMADRICVLQRGALVEEGTHSQLLAAGGIYAGMFETQSRSYRT